MPDALAAALAAPGLGWLILTIAAAGIVRGFTGFGTALIFVPVAGQYLPPAEVILVITTTGIASTTALLPRAWGQADRREVGALALAAMLTVPLGLWLLTRIDDTAIRWIAAGVAGATLVALITGWRWHGRLGTGGRIGIGGSAGVVGGLTGLTGPVVIIFYLANARSAASVRANTILFLAALDVVIVVNLLAGGLVGGRGLWLGAVLAVPYFCTTLVGQWLFDPVYERVYRAAAYGVILLAVVTGIPLFD